MKKRRSCVFVSYPPNPLNPPHVKWQLCFFDFFCVSVLLWQIPLTLLTLGTIVSRPSCLDDSFDSGAADETFFAEAIIHAKPVTIFFVRVSSGWTILAAQHFSNRDDESRESFLRQR